MKVINDKREEHFQILEKQFFNYRYAYIFFEKQLRKAYPKADDLSLYPSKEELLSKIGKIQNATQLMAFVKNIKEDLNENKIMEGQHDGLSLTPEESRRALIITSSKKINEFKNRKPTLVDSESDMEKATAILEEAIEKSLGNLFDLKNEIEDLATGDTFPKSQILKQPNWKDLKKWLPKDLSNKKIKLLYNSQKDGANGYTFHQKCDNQGPTYTVIKTKAGKSFGVFLKNSWHSNEGYVYDQDAYMFSVDKKQKYELVDKNTHAQYAGYGSASYGPTFGGGNDVYIPTNW